MTRRLFQSVVVLAAVSGTTALAQGFGPPPGGMPGAHPGGPPPVALIVSSPHGSRLLEQAQVPKELIAKVEALRAQFDEALRSQEQTLKGLHEQVRAQLEQGGDEATVVALLEKAAPLELEVKKLRTVQALRVRAVLGDAWMQRLRRGAAEARWPVRPA
ncbi:MAG: hypothetical protein SFW67_35935 [Myxococcaceae bacterium]|nr:hypothetical protein [Myxococcaceae bacterium]